ncbi:hypothetical protein LG272_10510 [Pseudidiomarina marina]|uniref:hypothetical protein n=1 Tax=Pseudidiomarina marina TaxID=502366 RepID=UPI00384D5C36
MNNVQNILIAATLAEQFAKENNLASYFRGKQKLFIPRIAHPEGGEIYIGDKSYEALTPLIKLAYQQDNNLKRVTFNEVRHLALGLFGDFLFGRIQGLETDEKFLKKLNERIMETLKSFQVVVPCNIGYPTDKEHEINFGSAKLINVMKLERLLNSEWKHLDDQVIEKYWIETENHYRKFFWFLVIDTPPVSSLEIARKIAKTTAYHAINLLHLFLPQIYSNKWEVGFHLNPTPQAYSIFSESRKLNYYIEQSFTGGNAGIDPSFWDDVQNGEMREYIEIQSICIDSFLNLRKPPPAVSRLLDATYWIGDAIRETSAPTRIIKYVMGLERLVFFKKERSCKKKIFANRITLLLIQIGFISRAEAGQMHLACKDLYRIRSEISHGASSPFEETLNLSINKVHDIARFSVMSYMRLVKDLTEENNTDTLLKNWFKRFVPELNFDDGD